MTLAGDRIVVWGGTSDLSQIVDGGAVYDLKSGTWQTIPVNKTFWRKDHKAMWTGKALAFYGGSPKCARSRRRSHTAPPSCNVVGRKANGGHLGAAISKNRE